jgi:hypothetical protein
MQAFFGCNVCVMCVETSVEAGSAMSQLSRATNRLGTSSQRCGSLQVGVVTNLADRVSKSREIRCKSGVTE